MSDDMLTILMLVGVLAFISIVLYAGIYAIKLNKAVNELKTPPNIEQIRNKQQRLAFALVVIAAILAFLLI